MSLDVEHKVSMAQGQEDSLSNRFDCPIYVFDLMYNWMRCYL